MRGLFHNFLQNKLGSFQVYFVKKNCNLKKKFITNSNILDISLGDKIAVTTNPTHVIEVI